MKLNGELTKMFVNGLCVVKADKDRNKENNLRLLCRVPKGTIEENREVQFIQIGCYDGGDTYEIFTYYYCNLPSAKKYFKDDVREDRVLTLLAEENKKSHSA